MFTNIFLFFLLTLMSIVFVLTVFFSFTIITLFWVMFSLTLLIIILLLLSGNIIMVYFFLFTYLTGAIVIFFFLTVSIPQKNRLNRVDSFNYTYSMFWLLLGLICVFKVLNFVDISVIYVLVDGGYNNISYNILEHTFYSNYLNLWLKWIVYEYLLEFLVLACAILIGVIGLNEFKL